ncbi:MAG: hypothetical protein Q8M00_00920 [bacterium]|nr:hypothetical protein [bacterium]
MPIQVKTMRDIWDKGKEKKETKSIKILPPKIEKYYLEYLARKKAFLETKYEIVKAFAEYEKKLGGGGFSKI